MRRFVNGDRFWEIWVDGKFVVTRYGALGKPPKEERRFCKDGAAAYLAERVHRRRAEPDWIEDRFRAAAPAPAAPTPKPVKPATAAPNAESAVGADLVRKRSAPLPPGLPEDLAGRAAALLDAAPAVGALQPNDRALLLTLVPSRAAADLVVARHGAEGLLRAVLEGAWPGRGVVQPGLRAKVELPPWLGRARELCATAPDRDAALAAARAADVAAWRLADASYVLADAGLARAALDRCDGLVTPAVAHLAADLDVDGWLALVRQTPAPHAATHPLVAVAPARRDQLVGWLPGLVARVGVAALAVPWVADDVALLQRLAHPDAARLLVERLAAPRKPKGKTVRTGPDLDDPALTALRSVPVPALIALATHGAPSEAADALARELAAVPEVVDGARAALDAAAARRLARWAAAAPLPDATEVPEVLRGKPAGPLPRWIVLAALPAVALADGSAALPALARAKLIEHLATTEHFAFDELDGLLERASLSSFALALFDQLVERIERDRASQQEEYDRDAERRREAAGDDGDGEGSARVWVRRVDTTVDEGERWVLRALSVFGDAEAARGLAARIRSFPSGLWQLSAQAVDALGGMANDTARVELGSLAQRGPVGASKRARLAMDASGGRSPGAEARVDAQLMPDLGLAPDGSMVLDFGPRTFRVGFDADLVPTVVDADGKVHRSLPRARASDDAAKAAAAAERWATLKRDQKKVATTLRQRLEDALRRGRAWPAPTFFRALANHPFGRHVAARLLWASGGRRFRLDETALPVDVDSAPIAVEAPVTLVHPATLEPAELAAWSGVFADYELAQPFEQLARAVHRADPSTDGGTRLPRLAGATFQRGRLFALQQRGWRWLRDGEDRDVITGLRGDWAPGWPHARLSVEADLVTVRWVELSSGTWVDLPPVAFSEVVRDLATTPG